MPQCGQCASILLRYRLLNQSPGHYSWCIAASADVFFRAQQTRSRHSTSGQFGLCHQSAEFAHARSYRGMLVAFVVRMQKIGFDGE